MNVRAGLPESLPDSCPVKLTDPAVETAKEVAPLTKTTPESPELATAS